MDLRGIDLDLGFLAGRGSSSAAKDWFDKTGLIPASFGCGAKWRESDSPQDFEKSLIALEGEAELAAALGCTRSATWVMPASNALDFRAHWNLVVPRLTKVAAILAAHGIRFGLEFVGPVTLRKNFKYNFVYGMDAMLGMCAAIGPNTGLLLDAFHAFTAHVTLADLTRLTNDDVVYVHLNDAVAGRGPDEQIDQEREMVATTGVLDISGFVGALRGIGYDGPMAVEPFSAAVKAMTVGDAVAFTSRSLDKALA